MRIGGDGHKFDMESTAPHNNPKTALPSRERSGTKG